MEDVATDRWLDSGEAAAMLRISKKTLWNWNHAGYGPRPKRELRGRATRLRYRESDVKDWLAEHQEMSE